MTSLNCIPMNVPSLCIPRVFSNISRERIFRIVDELGLGRILGIDMVPKVSEKGDKYNRIFIHFTAWSTNPDAEKARQIALSGGEFKILYDNPYFWKVSASTAIPRALVDSKLKSTPPKAKAMLEFDEPLTAAATATTTTATATYPTPESRREKYGPRPVYSDDKPRQNQRQQNQRQQNQRQQNQRQQNQRQSTDSKVYNDDNDAANSKAVSDLLDNLVVDQPQDIRKTIQQLNQFHHTNNSSSEIKPNHQKYKGKESKITKVDNTVEQFQQLHKQKFQERHIVVKEEEEEEAVAAKAVAAKAVAKVAAKVAKVAKAAKAVAAKVVIEVEEEGEVDENA